MIEIKTAPVVTNKPSGRMYLANHQLNITHKVWTLVELDAISTGFTDGIEDVTLHRITPGVAGFYLVIGQASVIVAVPDKRYVVQIRANGDTEKTKLGAHSSVAMSLTLVCTDIIYQAATDYLELLFYADIDVDTNDIYGGGLYTFLSVQRVR